MANAFDPRAHLIQLPRRVKDPDTGQWTTRNDEYLEVKYRLIWFREKYPHGHIGTEFLRLEWEQGIAICHCVVTDGEGGCAHGTGTETRKGFADFVERSETRAVGRALAMLGFGTQFASEELDELPHVADAPTPSTNGDFSSREVTTKAPKAEARMSAEAIEELVRLACETCGEDREAFATRCRRAMKLKPDLPITKRVLCESMTPEAYKVVFDWYTTLYAQLQRKTPEVSNGSTPPPQTPPEPTPATPAEGNPAVPQPGPSAEESLSAPEHGPNAAERDPAYHKLFQEALGWGISEREITHMLNHHDLAAARGILCKARKEALIAHVA